jgi:hypothetical protein
VLGKHTEAFNTLTGPGGRYEKNPQGAVRELLGKGLPPGSTAPRPTRGPGPKPAPPKPKGPKPVSEMTPEEIKREREATIARLQARKAARDAAAAPPPPPKPAVPDLADRVLPSGPKTALVFGKQGGTGKMFQDAWEQIEGIKGEVGENAKKVREFINKQQVMVNIGLTDDLAADLQRFAGNKLLLASQQKVVDVMESYQGAPVVHKLRGASVWAKRINDRLVDGDLSLLGDYLKPMKGSSGHTNAIHGIVNAYMRPSSIGINGKGAKELVANAERALKEMNAYIDFYKPGRITGPGPTIPPARPFSASGAEEDVSMRWFTTAIHELGHQVHYRGAGARPLGNAWSKLGGERFVSGYAHSNEREQFAEAFVQFVLNPKGLKASHPRLYAWVSNALEEALK